MLTAVKPSKEQTALKKNLKKILVNEGQFSLDHSIQ